jgi:uncharacterized protein YxeA
MKRIITWILIVIGVLTIKEFFSNKQQTAQPEPPSFLEKTASYLQSPEAQKISQEIIRGAINHALDKENENSREVYVKEHYRSLPNKK